MADLRVRGAVTPICDSAAQLELIRRLTPLRRSLVTDGFDEALGILGEHMPIEVVTVPSGTECWTWPIPKKWILEEGKCRPRERSRGADGHEHPLAVAPYSEAFDGEVDRDELVQHLRWSETWPDAFVYEYRYAINHRMSDWCMSMPWDRVRSLPEGRYRVEIDARLEEGSMKIGQALLRGRRPDIVIITSHLCHPGQANDGASGVAGMARIWAELAPRSQRTFSYLFLAPPETMGTLAWLWARQDLIPLLACGIDLEMLGVDNQLVLKLSHRGNAAIDRLARHALSGMDVRATGFRDGYGNDELVFADPDFDVPMVAIQHHPFPEYHTSRDDASTVVPTRLDEAHEAVMAMIDVIEDDYVPKRLFHGPVYLSRYDLYVDGHVDRDLHRQVWSIMQRLGTGLSVFEIAEEIGLPFRDLFSYLSRWEANGLIARTPSNFLVRNTP